MNAWVLLILIDVIFVSIYMYRLRWWDNKMRESDPTYERERVTQRSRPYVKMVRTILIMYGTAIVGAIGGMILEVFQYYSWVHRAACILGVNYLFLYPITLWQLFVAERREKQWWIIIHHKRKLTQKERREAEQKLKETSLFKRLNRIREEQ